MRYLLLILVITAIAWPSDDTPPTVERDTTCLLKGRFVLVLHSEGNRAQVLTASGDTIWLQDAGDLKLCKR